MSVRRWTFSGNGEHYTVPINPDRMGSLFGERAISARRNAAGGVLLFEASTPSATWQFSGQILDAAHYEALRHWVYDVPGRVLITDHFGRRIECALTSFAPEPKKAIDRYWRHTYTCSAIVVATSAPTVGV